MSGGAPPPPDFDDGFALAPEAAVPGKQIVVAAGEGAKAALSAHDWLLRLQARG